MREKNTFLRQIRVEETCLKYHTNENMLDFYKTLAINIVINIMSERLQL